jgi:hypothetical protein
MSKHAQAQQMSSSGTLFLIGTGLLAHSSISLAGRLACLQPAYRRHGLADIAPHFPVGDRVRQSRASSSYGAKPSLPRDDSSYYIGGSV